MATFKQALERAIKEDRMKMISVNQNMMQVSMSTKKKSGYVKSAVTDELAEGLLHRKRVAFILHIDADEMNGIAARIDEELASYKEDAV
jgi:uncharacterized protein YfeS